MLSKGFNPQNVRLQAAHRDLGPPVHHAAYEGRIDLLLWLLANGARRSDLDQQNDDGFTPLHWACRNGHLACAKWLASGFGAPSNTVDGRNDGDDNNDDDEGGLLAAVLRGEHGGRGADCRARGHRGWRPIHLACEAGHLSVVAWLIGYSPLPGDNDGYNDYDGSANGRSGNNEGSSAGGVTTTAIHSGGDSWGVSRADLFTPTRDGLT